MSQDMIWRHCVNGQRSNKQQKIQSSFDNQVEHPWQQNLPHTPLENVGGCVKQFDLLKHCLFAVLEVELLHGFTDVFAQFILCVWHLKCVVVTWMAVPARCAVACVLCRFVEA